MELMAYSSFLSPDDVNESSSSHDNRAVLHQLVVNEIVTRAFPLLWNPKFCSRIDKIAPLNQVLRGFTTSDVITNYFPKAYLSNALLFISTR
jgi:hypothetical protein